MGELHGQDPSHLATQADLRIETLLSRLGLSIRTRLRAPKKLSYSNYTFLLTSKLVSCYGSGVGWSDPPLTALPNFNPPNFPIKNHLCKYEPTCVSVRPSSPDLTQASP
jgi:hypothetical protein